MNNKGFTLIEILAAVTILAILTTLTIAGYSKYADQAKKRAHDNMAKSVSNAAEQFIMDNPGLAQETKKQVSGNKTTYVMKNANPIGISFEDLKEQGYLSETVDPDDKGLKCTGQVSIGLVKSDKAGALDRYIFVVDECCSIYKARYTYTYVETSTTENGKPKVVTSFEELKDMNHYTCP